MPQVPHGALHAFFEILAKPCAVWCQCCGEYGRQASGAGAKTGRSPKDKRVVVHPESQDNVWWGEHSPNKSLSADSYEQNRKIATSFLEQCSTVFVQDGFANWGTEVCPAQFCLLHKGVTTTYIVHKTVHNSQAMHVPPEECPYAGQDQGPGCLHPCLPCTVHA